MRLEIAALDALDLEKTLLGEDGDAVVILVELPLQLVADVPLGEGLCEGRREAELGQLRSC